jgi:hypothetical protein
MRISKESALGLLATIAVGAIGCGPAMADDPLDPAMATRTARERDRAIIRQLNDDQLAHVRERDAGYAQGWQTYREGRAANTPRPEQRSDAGQGAYAHALEEYDAAMAEWRRDVSDCRAGYYERCAR